MIVSRLLVLISLVAFSSLGYGEELSDQKRADIEKLLEITGATGIGQQMANAVVGQMTETIRTLRPDIPQAVIDVLPAEVEAVLDANMASFKAQLTPIYHKYFTGAEIKGMIDFYSTDLGKKTISVLPSLMSDSFLVGQRWGESMGPEIERRVKARLEKEGYSL